MIAREGGEDARDQVCNKLNECENVRAVGTGGWIKEIPSVKHEEL